MRIEIHEYVFVGVRYWVAVVDGVHVTTAFQQLEALGRALDVVVDDLQQGREPRGLASPKRGVTLSEGETAWEIRTGLGWFVVKDGNGNLRHSPPPAPSEAVVADEADVSSHI